MNTYLLIFLLLLCFAFLEISNVSNKTLKVLHTVIAFVFIFVAGLRFETGVDWLAYQEYFDEIMPLHEAFLNNSLSNVFLNLDVGYSLLNSIVKMFGGNIQVVFFIISLTSTVLLIKNLKYYSNHVLTSLFVFFSFFFFIFDMSGLRQGLAIQIVLFSLRFITERKFKQFLLCIVLATSIHWTAIILLLLYVFANKKVSIKYTVFLFFISIVIFTFKIKWVGGVLGDLAGSLNAFSTLSNKLTVYTTSEVFSKERGWDLFSIYNFLRITIIVLLAHLFKNKMEKNLPHFTIFYNFMLLELVCIFCLFEFFEISERLRYYFTIAEIIFLANLIFILRNHIVRIFALMLLTICIFLNAYPFLLQFPSTVAYQPYQNYLIYTIFDLRSDGYSRLQEHKASHE